MWQCVARGNIHSPDGAAFTLWAHAALSGECDYYLQYLLSYSSVFPS